MKHHSCARGVLWAYFTHALIGKTLLCSAVLVCLLEILTLLEVTTTILARGLGLHGLIRYMGLKLPILALQTLPLSTQLGGLFLFVRMSLSSEMASLRAAGLSTQRLACFCLPAIGFLSLAGMLMQECVIPPAELTFSRWWNNTDPLAEKTKQNIWFHDAGALVHIEGVSHGGRVLHHITTYQRGADGSLHERRAARRVTFHPARGWAAQEVQTLVLTDPKALFHYPGDVTLLPAALTPDNILELTQRNPALSTWSLWHILHQGGAASLPKATYRVALFTPLMLPISLLTVLILTLPVINIPPRTGARSLIPLASLAAGFCFVILQGLLQALGNVGTLPALVAVSAPPVAALLLGCAWIIKMEDL